MGKKKRFFQFARKFSTGIILTLCALLVNAQPQTTKHEHLINHEGIKEDVGISARHNTSEATNTKTRVIVTTDGEIDDQCSLVRFLLYTNEFDVEGIIKSSSQYHWQGHNWAGDNWEVPFVDAYEQVYPNLVNHDQDYPTPEYIRSRVKLGNVKSEGEMTEVTPGSQLIVDVLLDETDNRPIWLQAWGGMNTIARALKTIEEDYPERMEEVANKIRFFFIWEQDGTYQSYIRPHWAKPYNILTIISDQFITFGYWWKDWDLPDEMAHYFSASWMKENLLENHGPLLQSYKAQSSGAFRSEGDSPSFIHEIPTGLRNLESPEWGGWGGRYVLIRENTWLDKVPVDGYEYPSGRWYTRSAWGRKSLRNNSATHEELLEYFKPIWRWIDVMQNDFAARADWCIKPYAEANHPPVVSLANALEISAQPGENVQLSAQGSYDPDGDQLTYSWWQYEEADSYEGTITIQNAGNENANFTVPSDAKTDETIHVICEVKDMGLPPLTRYQRVIVTVGPSVTVPVTGISIAPTETTIDIGATTQLTATVEPINATNKGVNWNSSNTAVATVNSSGVVTGVSNGSASITATTQDGGFTATCNVTIKAVDVTGVSLSSTTASIGVEEEMQLTAVIVPSNATNKNVNWSSSNTAVAIVSSSGLVIGITEGLADITVTTEDGNFTAICNVSVTNIDVTGVSISPATANLSVGTSIQLSASVIPSNATNKIVSWNSSNTGVATVSPSGLVSGLAEGTATITATTEEGGFTATCDVTVSDIVIKTLTIQENEPGVISYDGSIDNNHSGHTGDGFINTDNASGKGISWQICVPSNGTYSLQWKYANGASANRTAQLKVDNAVTVLNVGFPSTGAWNSWGNTSTVDIALSAGVHLIRLEATNSSGLANIDYISIEGNNPQAGECNDVPVTGVRVSCPTEPLVIGETLQLTATVEPPNASNKNVSWNSSNPSVATISPSGLLKAISEGISTVSVITEDGNFIGTCDITVLSIDVSGVSVLPTSATLNIDETIQLTATVEPSNATNKNVSWSSSNTAVASVNQSGLVMCIAAGTAMITATTQDGGFEATSVITVNSIPVTSVTISPTKASVYNGESIQLTATVMPSNSTNKNISWGSSDTAVATVSPSGLVTGVATSIPLTGISISSTMVTLGVGDTAHLTSTVHPHSQHANITATSEDGEHTATCDLTVILNNQEVTWSSSNTSVATVDHSGIVTGIAPGMATITVTSVDGGFTATCEVTVPTNAVTGVSVSPASALLSIGEAIQLSAIIAPSNATDKTVTWGSSDTYVANITTSGLVTGLAVGHAIVTVTTVDGGYTAICEVDVTDNTETTIAIQENENGFCGVDGSVDNNNSGFTGDGFANTDNSAGNGIDWKVNFGASGTYTFNWHFANGSSARPADLIINGSTVASNINFAGTGSWTSWDEVSTVASITKGINNVRLEAIGGGGLANIDFIEITGINPQSASCQAPALAVNPGTLPFGEVAVGSTGILSYTITGSNLSGNITINAPSPFSVSTTDVGSYGPSVTLEPSGGGISETVYVKFAPVAVQGYSGNITNTTDGLPVQYLTASGTGVESLPPALVIDPSSMDFGSVLTGSSKTLSYTLSGSNLAPPSSNITITAPSAFEVSTSAGSGFSSSITVPYNNGSMSQAVYVKFAPTTEQGYNGSVSNSGGGASTQDLAISGYGTSVQYDKPRVIVTSDIGGTDPDDFQSMVHFLLYTDVLDVEGIISSPHSTGRKENILEVINKYEIDYPNLVTYSTDYPTPDELRAITKNGAPGSEKGGYGQQIGNPTEGSQLIVNAALRDDPRPLFILVWGSIGDVAQAVHDAPEIKSKIRVYFIGGPNKKGCADTYNYLEVNHKDLWIIENNSSYRGFFNGGNMSGSYSNSGFVSAHIKGHGALGNYFNSKKSDIKMGDTPSVCYVLNNNLDDPSQPGWGGAFVRAWERSHLIEHEVKTGGVMERFGIYELQIPVDGVTDPWAVIHVANQNRPGSVVNGKMELRCSSKNAETLSYRTTSNIPALNGKQGSFRAVQPSPDQANHPSAAHPNWWTDNPDPGLQEGSEQGAKTVNQWRTEFLDDFAARMDRCLAPKSNSAKSSTFAGKAGQDKSLFAVKQFYPNPVNEVLSIEFNQVPSEPVTIYLLDITGKPVTSAQTSGTQYSLDMSGLPSGIYILKITGPDLNFKGTVAKQ